VTAAAGSAARGRGGVRKYTPIATINPKPKPNIIQTQPGADCLRLE
jgi:hypothetical protein